MARAAFPKGAVAMGMRELLGGFVRDHDPDRVYLPRGRPVEAPWRMALVTVLQFREGLSDRQAAAAVRGRIDGTYALSRELTDSGFDYSVLSAFRTRLVERGDGEERAFVDRLLQEARWRGWLEVEHEALQAARRTQDTDAFKDQYAARAGIEGTISHGTRACDPRRARYTGLTKTHLQHVFTAAAINVTRLVAWARETPLAATRTSPFARLQQAA